MTDDRDELEQEKLDQMNPEKVQQRNFLDAISQIESSGGQNINHPIVQMGLQSGQKAIGNYGLMPNTINELNNRARLNHTMTPEMAATSRNPSSIQEDPKIQQQYANQLADHVLKKYQDPEMAAYSWNKGHNLTLDEIKQRHYADDPYVQKFKKIWRSLGNK